MSGTRTFPHVSSTGPNRSLKISLIVESSVYRYIISLHRIYLFWGKVNATLESEIQFIKREYNIISMALKEMHMHSYFSVSKKTLYITTDINVAVKDSTNLRGNSMWVVQQLCSTAGYHVSASVAGDENWDCCRHIPSIEIIYTMCPTSVHIPLVIIKCIIQTRVSAKWFAQSPSVLLWAGVQSASLFLSTLRNWNFRRAKHKMYLQILLAIHWLLFLVWAGV